MCFATILSWWPTARSVHESSTRTVEHGGIGYGAGRPGPEPLVSATLEPQPAEGPGPEINQTGIADESSRVKNKLDAEVVTLKFDTGGGPLAVGVLPILENYWHELVRGRLDGYTFSSRQLCLVNPTEHDRLVGNFRRHGYCGVQRAFEEMNGWYFRGTAMLLNLLFVGNGQVTYAWKSVYWFNRAVRHRQVTLMRQALPKARGRYGWDFCSNLLGGNFDEIEQFYGTPVIRIDLWNPDDPNDYIPCFFPKNGFAGDWFMQNPSRPGKYFPRHYDPREYYNFLMPQMMLRHIAGGERLILDFSKFHIGAG
jgi:hypothetical protein